MKFVAANSLAFLTAPTTRNPQLLAYSGAWEQSATRLRETLGWPIGGTHRRYHVVYFAAVSMPNSGEPGGELSWLPRGTRVRVPPYKNSLCHLRV